jgi:L-aspartate oxidase
MEHEHFDIVIVGTGIAGLATALFLDPRMKILMITKSLAQSCNTIRAEGGVAAAMGPTDSPELHFLDTLRAGKELSSRETAKILAYEMIDRAFELDQMGFPFDKNSDGSFMLGLEGFHSRRRILHSTGDRFGKAIFTFLLQQIKQKSNIQIREQTWFSDFFIHKGHYSGCLLYHDSSYYQVSSSYLVLGAGGYSGIYGSSTGESSLYGDVLALGFNRGLNLVDLEFVQFHPTVLSQPGFEPFLLTEALRGEGAVLLNSQNETFMERYHPEKDLASRDIVSKSIIQEIRQQGNDGIYLDMRPIGSDLLKKKFPGVYATCMERGVDPTLHPVKIHPSAHYTMGGIRTNTYGESSIPGIYAIGEVACNGLHGANRLASNSLADALVFGKRAAKHMEASTPPTPITLSRPSRHSELSTLILPPESDIKAFNWKYLGIERKEKDLTEYLAYLSPYYRYAMLSLHPTDQQYSRKMLCITSYLVTVAALYRKESRGCHHRSDYPEMKEEYQKSLVLSHQTHGHDLVLNYEKRG